MSASGRLDSEVLPADLVLLLRHANQVVDRLGATLHAAPEWAPWRSAGLPHLGVVADSLRYARAEATARVCERIRFVLAMENGSHVGYWRGNGPVPAALAGAPLVKFDRGGTFAVCAGRSLAEMLLSEYSCSDYQRFQELRDWLHELGIRPLPATEFDIPWPEVWPTPAQLVEELTRHPRRG